MNQWVKWNAPPEPKPLPEVFPKRLPPVVAEFVAPKPVLVFEVPKPEGANSLTRCFASCGAEKPWDDAPVPAKHKE